ncbi:restriction endonuclease subunit S [Alistipes finegoldii]|uniref:restriction endonuclease subunit S n=1 Tax=Alistipes finegoldii TaxID=214856 RepID=UPI003A943DFC
MATNNNDKTLNVPHLRFPEFTGEWRYSFLNEYLEENKERNKKGLFDKTTVLSVSGDFGIVNQIRLLGRSFAGKSVLDYHVVRYGNIVYTKSPLKEYPYGIVKINNGVDGIVSTLYAVYNVKSNASGCFIENYFALPRRTNKYFKPIVRIGAKHDMKISNEEAIANVVCFPQYAEQQKIAEFLSLIDDRIVSQNKIIEKLESLIRGIYKTLLGESDQYRYLDELCEIKKGVQVNKEELSEKGLYYVMNGGITPSGYYDLYNTEANTISISEGGNSCGYVQYNYTPFWSGGHCYTLENISDVVDDRYLFHYLKANELQIMSLRIGSGLPNIQKKDLSAFRIPLPALNKQINIAKALDALLYKITVDKNIYSTYKQQKEYLLQQMFI